MAAKSLDLNSTLDFSVLYYIYLPKGTMREITGTVL